MNKIIIALVAFFSVTVFIGCSNKTYPTGRRDEPVIINRDGKVIERNGSVSRLPPGQAKKVYGAKSAKAYAPGQRKKNFNKNTNKKNNKKAKKNGKGKN